MIEPALILPSFVAVFLKVLQQKNVMHDRYWFAPFVSYGMAYAEVFIIAGVIALGPSWAAVNGIALGGVVGSFLGMFIHNRTFR